MVSRLMIVLLHASQSFSWFVLTEYPLIEHVDVHSIERYSGRNRRLSADGQVLTYAGMMLPILTTLIFLLPIYPYVRCAFAFGCSHCLFMHAVVSQFSLSEFFLCSPFVILHTINAWIQASSNEIVVDRVALPILTVYRLNTVSVILLVIVTI